MIYLKMKIKNLVLVTISLYLFSCIKIQPVDLSSYVWPKPPEEPSIKLVKVIITDLDVRPLSFTERIFGPEVSFSFGKPYDIAVDKRGIIYVTDDQRKEVVKIDQKKKSISALTNPGFQWPIGIAYDEVNDLLAVADAQRAVVYVFDAMSGSLKFVIGQKGEFRNPAGVAFDSERGRLYVTDSKNHELKVFDLEGRYITTLATGAREKIGLYFPSDIAVDKEGKIYLIDSLNFRFVVLDPDGNLINAIGEHGDRLGMFARPKGIGVDSEGHIYVSDAAFANIQVFDIEGNTYTYVGSAGYGLGEFLLPLGLHIDKNDLIYVADSYNRRIQVFQYMSNNIKRHSNYNPLQNEINSSTTSCRASKTLTVSFLPSIKTG